MPCYDERSSSSYIYEHELRPLEKRLEKVEAILCGVFTRLEKGGFGSESLNDLPWFLDKLDYKEMGVTRVQVLQWWENHKEEDKRRKAEEVVRKRRVRANKRAQLITAESLVRRLKKELEE